MWFTKRRRAQNDQDYETWIVGGVSPTLNAFDNAHETRATVVIVSGDCIAIPIQDGREMEKKQNGMGVGKEGDPSYTLDQTGAQAVAIQGTIIGRSDTAGPQGRGVAEPGEPMYTLDTISQHGVEHMMQVRRLTPIECERLMGWPDNHTATGTNGPVSDTNRYKMCGNGVASPVAQWIGEHLMRITDSRPDSE